MYGLSEGLESWWRILYDTRIMFYHERVVIFRGIWIGTSGGIFIIYTEVVDVVFYSIIIVTCCSTEIIKGRTDSSSIFRASSDSIVSSDRSFYIELIAWYIDKERFFGYIVWRESACEELFTRKHTPLSEHSCLYLFHRSFYPDISSLSFFIFECDDSARCVECDRSECIYIEIYISTDDDETA